MHRPTDGAMGRQIKSSLGGPIELFLVPAWYNKGRGICYPVCRMVDPAPLVNIIPKSQS